MSKFHILGTLCVSSLLMASALGAQAGKINPKDVRQPLPGPIGGPVKPTGPLAPVACRVDPAIGSINLAKGKGAGSAQVTVEVKNMGRDAWQSGPRQQQLVIVVKNGNSGAVWNRTYTLTTRAAAGARMGYFTTAVIPRAFDDFEFGGTVEARINYDPDIAIDGQRCNDDTNAANNVKLINTEQVFGFISGSARSQSF